MALLLVLGVSTSGGAFPAPLGTWAPSLSLDSAEMAPLGPLPSPDYPIPHQTLTWASCSRSSRRVTVMVRSQVYFLRMVSCSFCSCSSASRTSEKNWGQQETSHSSRRGPSQSHHPHPQDWSWAGKARDGRGADLEVGRVLLQMRLNAAAQL